MTIRTAPVLFWFLIFLLFGYFIYLVSDILLPFVVGMGLAYILDPLADRLEKRGMSRTLATTTISGTFFLFATIAVVFSAPLLLQQLNIFVAELPNYISVVRDTIEPYINSVKTKLDIQQKQELKNLTGSLGDSATSIARGVLNGIMKSGIALANFASLLIITPVVAFYFLRDWDVIVSKIDDLLPRHYADIIREQCASINLTLSSFMRGTLNVMLVLAMFYAISLTLAGLKYSLLIALISGIMIIIPFLGTIISGSLAVGLAYLQFDDVNSVGIIAGIFIAGQMLEGYVLTPKLVGDSVGLNPVWIIFGMLAGGAIMGFVGILIAVPVTAVCGVLLRFALEKYRESDFYYGEGKPAPLREGDSAD
jgi:predicted PurR-regulated permease PerM